MKRFYLSQTFMFDAAHTLHRTVPLEEYQASKRIHGHTYTAEVTLTGVKGEDGMLITPAGGKRRKFLTLDLYILRQAIEQVRDKLDHRFLDAVPGLGDPTMENLCKFIAAQVGDTLPVCAVTVSRSTGDKCRLELTEAA